MSPNASVAPRIVGAHDERTIAQLRRCIEAEDGSVGVLCADGHVGYSMPIGGVVGYRRHVSPSGVGYDIACGNLAVRTNVKAASLPAEEYDRLADEIQRQVSFGMGRKNAEPVDDDVLDEIAHSPVTVQRGFWRLAADQLGTVGAGNHYVDVLEDEDGWLWIGVHFGSRGFGHKTAKGFMNIAAGRAFDARGAEGEMDAPPLLLPINTPSGEDYIAAMQIAGRYAYAGRSQVVKRVLGILGASETFIVHNHHNFSWLEPHEVGTLWVVRKGATPARPGQYGFVGGSMGDISVILKGVESSTSRELLYSTVHGAGRVMSRTEAAGKQKWTKARWTCRNYRTCAFEAPAATFERGADGSLPICPTCGGKLQRQNAHMRRLATGKVDFEAEKSKLSARGIVLRGAGADEAPPVYRQLADVLAAHSDTIKVEHYLQPRIVVMAGADEVDDYKD